MPLQALLEPQVRKGCPMGYRSENRVTLGQVPTCQKAKNEFRRETGPANGEEVLGS